MLWQHLPLACVCFVWVSIHRVMFISVCVLILMPQWLYMCVCVCVKGVFINLLNGILLHFMSAFVVVVVCHCCCSSHFYEHTQRHIHIHAHKLTTHSHTITHTHSHTYQSHAFTLIFRLPFASCFIDFLCAHFLSLLFFFLSIFYSLSISK